MFHSPGVFLLSLLFILIFCNVNVYLFCIGPALTFGAPFDDVNLRKLQVGMRSVVKR